MSLRGGEDRRRHLHLAQVQVSNLRYELGIASPSFDYTATTSGAAQDGSQ